MNTRFSLNQKATFVSSVFSICLLGACSTAIDLSHEGFKESANPKALIESAYNKLDQNAYSLKSSAAKETQSSNPEGATKFSWNATQSKDWWKALSLIHI